MNDYNFLKNEFDSDGLQAPESLSADRMREMIDAQPSAGTKKEEGTWEKLAHEPRGTFWKRQLRYAVALAACLVVALIAIPAARKAVGPENAAVKTDKSGKDTAAEKPWELVTFSNEKEIKAALDRANSEDWNIQNLFGRKETGTVEEYAETEATGDAAASAEDHAQTYKQVEGVDEADIIKTDGKYIYHVNGDQGIDIFRAKDGKAEKQATIDRFADDGYIHSMYLDGDRLVTVGYVTKNNSRESALTVYDITDREKPVETGVFRQSGSVISSRMTDGIVYLITRDLADYRQLVPRVTRDGKYQDVAIEDVAAFPDFADTSYAVISAVDCRTGEKLAGRTKAVLGVADDIYCNQEHLYLACCDYSSDQTATKILKADLDKSNLKWTATGKVRGEIYGQFAMDEREGDFRIATTSERNGKTVNNLYILDGDLDERGSVTGFARGEEIKAVRYIGERAYVITYEQTDPLFVLDVSDPEDPRIDGEVKIDGFSSLLVPTGKDRLIGIGYINGNSDAAEGIKLALFDVKDPSNPRVLDEKKFEGIVSDAQYDHHALVENKEEGYLAVPYSYRDRRDDTIVEDAEEPEETADSYMPPKEQTEYGGVLVFNGDDGRIRMIDNHEIKDHAVSRCTYIGEYIYAVTEDDEVVGFKM